MNSRRWLYVAVIAVGLAGCRPAAFAPESQIVREAKAAGSGDLSKADVGSIKLWFTKQDRSFKQHLRGECGTAMKSADSSWKASDEGRLCEVVIQTCFWGGCAPVGQ